MVFRFLNQPSEPLPTQIRVENRKAEITLNGQRLFSETFREDFGNIMALTYIFSGTGSIDHVKLTGINGAVAFEDNFDQ
ncbi:hypothetical protein [Leadbetterella sp. DM7]|uniref:hypothetical protein n=1 Tax=Leadbetterella sp. DM7 TaxID=3235085 RepID=UPI00349E6F0A